MTFDLSAEILAARDAAKQFAETRVQPVAEAIDRDAAIPADVLRDATALVAGQMGAALVLTVEELAAASAALAIAAAAGGDAPSVRWSGLRGAPVVTASDRVQLVLSAVALGVGRAALDASLGDLRSTATGRGMDSDTPQWVVADAATALEAGRVLTFKAATEAPSVAGHIAMARLMTTTAARDAVTAATRLGGEASLRAGALLDRLTRDANTLAVIGGTEEALRATAAATTLPQ